MAHVDQGELDRLFTAALEAAIALIEKRGSFLPLLFELRAAGDVQAVAVLEKGNIDTTESLVDRFAAILRPRAEDGTIRAAAVAIQREEAIEVRTRAIGYSANIIVPYTLETSGLIRKRRKVTLGDITSEDAPNDIFV